MLSVLPFFLPITPIHPPPPVSLPPALIEVAQATVIIPKFPDYTQNYTNTVVIPAACAAQGGSLRPDLSCYVPPVYKAPAYEAAPVTEVPVASYGDSLTGSLLGSVGYSLPYGNCVDEPGVNNPGLGNPISWPVTSSTPWIGASALFIFNHVAVVSGIWSNGDIEVRQQNSPNMPHRISPSLIRGFR